MKLFDPFADQVRAFTDEQLLAAYKKASGSPSDTAANDLLAEIKRRGLSV